MPDRAGEFKSDIRAFLRRAPHPGASYPCSVEFLRVRARAVLIRLRGRLLQDSPFRIEPAVCYAVPYALEPRPVPGGYLDIYGFDFDAGVPQMVLVHRDGYEDVTSAVVEQSDTHMRLDLARVPFSQTSLSLGLAWNHVIRHSIALIHDRTALCSSRIEAIPGGRTASLTLSRVAEYQMAAAGGETAIWAEADLDYANNKIEATVCATADRGRTGRVFSQCQVEFLYTTDADRVIEGIVGAISSHVAFPRDGPSDDTPASKRLVRRWALPASRSDGADNDEVAISAQLGKIRVASTDDRNGCVSPIAYKEAKLTHELSEATMRTLDRELKSVDPLIMTLRPRFAPR